jgi:hypothetical protein
MLQGSDVTPTLHFCTLFDSKYASRGLTMLESLAEHMREPYHVTILAMDAAIPDLITRVGRPEWKVSTVASLGDAEFAALEAFRPRREYCWTAAPVLCDALVRCSAPGSFVVYVDADLLFYDDPRLLLGELEPDGQILIHEHRYSRDRTQWEATSGRFNVGFLAFRVGDEARACTARWRQQVFEKCELDPDNGYCGDQGYLNEWPSLYPGLRIMCNIGGGVAPWNLADYRPSGSARLPRVDGKDLVFFHYHSFRTVAAGALGFVAAQPAYGYGFPRRVNRLFFATYARRVRRSAEKLRRAGLPIVADEVVSLRQAMRSVVSGRYLLAY